MTDTTEVHRWRPVHGGDAWVRATDYDALAAKLAELEADTHKIMVAYATAHAAVLGVAQMMTDTIEAPDILPCPFCGGEATHNDGGNSAYGRLWWCVGCENCDVWFADEEVWSKTEHGMLDPAYPPKHCFKVWNTRTYDFIGIMDDD